MSNEDDPMEGSSDLFSSVMGGISDEQWEEYQMMRKLGGGYFLNSESESDLDEDGVETVTNIELVHDDETAVTSKSFEEEDDDDDDYDQDDDDYEEEDDYGEEDDDDGDNYENDSDYEEYKTEKAQKPLSPITKCLPWNSEDAVKFVNGEISFTEFAERAENATKKITLKRTADGKRKEETLEAETTDNVAQKAKKGRRRKATDLPKELASHMGMANLAFANGDKEKALQICHDLIRQAPMAYDPYQTIALIYEDKGDIKQALQCYLLAAYLDPSNTEEWIRLASLSVEQNQIPQAIKCYSYAIRNEPKNIDYFFERCNLYEIIGDKRNTLAGYEQILTLLNRPEDGQKCVEISREVAKVHHGNEDLTNAIKVLESAFTKFPSLITSDDINLLLELHITKQQYKAALKNFISHCGVQLVTESSETLSLEDIDDYSEEQFQGICKYVMSDVVPIDLQVKLVVCLIYLGALKSTEEMIESLLKENVEEMGDLYLDVADALMIVQEHSRALPLLKQLTSSQKFNIAVIWMKYGDCLNAVTHGPEVTQAYERVLTLAPSYQEARLSLSKILIEGGKKQEAAEVLKQEYERGQMDAVMDVQVLMERCNLLYEREEYEEFIKIARLAQYSHCFELRGTEEFLLILNNQSYKRRIDALRELPTFVDRVKPPFHALPSTTEPMWSIFKKLVGKLFEQKRYEELQSICLESMSSNLWRKDKKLSQDVETMALFSSYFNKNFKFNYNLVKDNIVKDIHSNRLWNLLGLNISYSQQIRHTRFCLRSLMKNPNHLALGLFNGYCAMNSGSYKDALGLYVSQLKKHPNDPLLLFLVGITYTQMACQKFATKRQLLVTQAITFLKKYMEYRFHNQESLYNVGRAFHQLGIKDAAAFYYKQALAAPCVVSDPADKEVFDLSHEIAFNLALIYKSSGSEDLACSYLRTHNVV